ncbi:Phosphoglycolate phosphatase 2 [Smittium culicis]|uniref:4-nitrophenylphosphatase n=1 Tax=Smittium culicis TaxID=133412 RepID=A0A1R1YT50_9FUNG|nr:Phosphoglycolate phosphatase 2 [Smittium culicis]
MTQHLSSSAEHSTLIDKYETFLFDCDGVIWLGSKLIPGVKESIEYLKCKGKKLIFITNNSSVSRADYVKKFAKFGIEVDESNIFGSSFATAVYLKEVANFDPEKFVFAIGGKGISDELESQGIKILSPDFPQIENLDDISGIEPDNRVGAVVVGLDVKINYAKLAFAHVNIIQGDSYFIATNSDSTLPVGGITFPGAGSLLSVLKSSTKKDPVVIGKPNQIMFDLVKKSHHLDLSKTIMVGDRLDTDIDFGNRASVDTLLVYTGVTDKTLASNSDIKATFSMNSFGDISLLKQ